MVVWRGGGSKWYGGCKMTFGEGVRWQFSEGGSKMVAIEEGGEDCSSARGYLGILFLQFRTCVYV